MNRIKKGLIVLLGGAMIFGSGVTRSLAAPVVGETIEYSESSNEIVKPFAAPVSASISQSKRIYPGVSTQKHTVTLRWGGGQLNTYNVKYYDGKVYGIQDSYNSYSTPYTQTYSRGSLTEKTWNTRLEVRNGISSSTATSYVKLTR